jgi:hypothetical protein
MRLEAQGDPVVVALIPQLQPVLVPQAKVSLVATAPQVQAGAGEVPGQWVRLLLVLLLQAMAV